MIKFLTHRITFSVLLLGLGFVVGKYLPNQVKTTENKTDLSKTEKVYFQDDKDFQFWNTIYSLLGNSVTVITGSAILMSWVLIVNKGQVPYCLVKLILADSNGLLFSDTRYSLILRTSTHVKIELKQLEAILYRFNGVAKKAQLTTGIFNSISSFKQFNFEAEYDTNPIIPDLLSSIHINDSTKVPTSAKNTILEIFSTWENYVRYKVTGGQFFCIQKAIILNLLDRKIDDVDFQRVWFTVHRMFASDLLSKANPLDLSSIPSILPILKWYVKDDKDGFEIEMQKISPTSSNFSTEVYNVFYQFTH
jgi:hypothetical protein